MVKRKYSSPVVMLEPDEGDPDLPFGPSTGTSGYDLWEYVGIDEDTLLLIELNCDDIDLQEMDTDDDFVITKDEFDAWYAIHQPW